MVPATNWYIGSTKFWQQKEPVTGFKRSFLSLQELGQGITSTALHSVQGPEGLKEVHFNTLSKCPTNDKHEGAPDKWCHCGFYSYLDMNKAYSHLRAYEARGTVILKTVSSGKMIMYSEGVRAGRQRVTEIMVDKCYFDGCDKYADRMCVTDKEKRLLSGVCAKHAGYRYGKLYSFSTIQKKIKETLTEGEPEITVSSFHSKVKPWKGEIDIYKRKDFVYDALAGAVLTTAAIIARREFFPIK